MPKQFKLMIYVNVLLGFFFVVSNLVYDYFGNMQSHYALWSPLWMTFYNSNIVDLGAQEPNFSFYFFWALLLINVYFIVRLQRSKETKQTSSQNNT